MKAAISRCIIMVTLIHYSVTKFYLMSVKDKKKSTTRPKTRPLAIKDGSDYLGSDYSNGEWEQEQDHGFNRYNIHKSF